MQKNLAIHGCKNANDGAIITDALNGEIICSSCGAVLDEKIVDRSSDVVLGSPDHYFSKSRTGTPSKLSMTDMGVSSIMSKKNMDASGKYFSSKTKGYFSRLRLWDSRSRKGTKDANLSSAFLILDSFKDRLSLPENVQEYAAYLYRKASQKKLIRGQSMLDMMSASVYASCKILGVPRSLDDVANAANIQRKTLSRCYRRIVRKLKLESAVRSESVDYITKVANSVNADELSKRLSSTILNDAKKESIHVGKNPVGLAAASVYLSCIGRGQNISMATISRKSNISTVTIRKLSKLLRPFAAKYVTTIEISS